MRTPPLTHAIEALGRRLRAVQPYLAPRTDRELDVGPLLSSLARAVAADGRDEALWLLGTAIAAGYPTQAEVLTMRRGLELAAPGEELGAVLAGVAVTASAARDPDAELTILDGATIVDVDFCARHVHNTGIQRVVRNTMPHWATRPEVVLVAWSDDATGYRTLTPQQADLVLNYRAGLSEPTDRVSSPVIVPWRSSIILPEVPARHLLERQAALGRHSGNSVALIGYDAIPIVSADTVVDAESDRFAHYLEVVKYAHRVSCISAATAEEFAGFVEALPAQGLVGPHVSTVTLPVDSPATTEPPVSHEPREGQLVLMVGSVEPRKNQHGVLSAAQTLWDEGLDFELYVIGGGHSWYLQEFDATVARLRSRGRRVRVGRGVSDADLADAYRAARVVVFPSLQEGFGLPVAEALATGTPVITTEYGSTAAIAAQGGCIVVNPRNDDEIASALRRVLTDDDLHARLVDEALHRTNATWLDYANALWADTVATVPHVPSETAT